MYLQLDLQMGRFSVHFRYCHYFEGVMAGAWRTPVSGYFSCSVFWDSGKRNMELTTVFTVPNAHHIFGSRHRFSEFVVPSGIHFGGCWIVFFWGTPHTSHFLMAHNIGWNLCFCGGPTHTSLPNGPQQLAWLPHLLQTTFYGGRRAGRAWTIPSMKAGRAWTIPRTIY